MREHNFLFENFNTKSVPEYKNFTAILLITNKIR
jgi:hypothetical protein